MKYFGKLLCLFLSAVMIASFPCAASALVFHDTFGITSGSSSQASAPAPSSKPAPEPSSSAAPKPSSSKPASSPSSQAASSSSSGSSVPAASSLGSRPNAGRVETEGEGSSEESSALIAVPYLPEAVSGASSSVSLPNVKVSEAGELIASGTEAAAGKKNFNIIGVVSWICIGLGVVVVIVVLLSTTRRPPRSGFGRKRYRRRTGRPRKKRLLNDRYYRNNRY